jgi:hypothetical protein
VTNIARLALFGSDDDIKAALEFFGVVVERN